MRHSKKESILKAGVKHFSKKGYDATTLESIAQECNITKPAIYYHFKDKAALYEAVVCSEFTIVAEQIEKATQEGTAIERIQKYIAAFGKHLIDNPNFNAIFAREIAAGAHTLPKNCTKILSRTLYRLIIILNDGKKEGIFGEENPFMIQMLIVSTLTTYKTSELLRERIAGSLGEDIPLLEPHFENVIEDLSGKIIKVLTC